MFNRQNCHDSTYIDVLFAFHELVSRYYFIIVPSTIFQDTIPFFLDCIKITFMLMPVLPVDQVVDTCINFNGCWLVMWFWLHGFNRHWRYNLGVQGMTNALCHFISIKCRLRRFGTCQVRLFEIRWMAAFVRIKVSSHLIRTCYNPPRFIMGVSLIIL